MTKAKHPPQLMPEDVVNATFQLIEDKGWVNLSLLDIAQHLGTTLAALHTLYPSKSEIMKALIHSIEQKTLKHIAPVMEDYTEQERFFEVLMARFEVAQAHKKAIAILYQELSSHPTFFVDMVPLGLSSMTWLLEAAGFHPTGALGFLQTKFFALLYLRLVYVWLKDETPDMAPTMAEVNKVSETLLPYVLHPKKLLNICGVL
jgi:ubiquinone biosynthesis protein COQ9